MQQSHPRTGTLAAEPHPDVPALLGECEQAALEREGIAMFVALPDARPGRKDPATRTAIPNDEAARLRELFDHYAARLAEVTATREPEDDPTGALELIEVLVVLSQHHLRAPVD